MTASVRILVADDHEVFRRSVRSLLESRAGWEVCGEAVDGDDAIQKAKELKPDIVVLDISMPRRNGLDVARVLRRETPQSEILIVSQHDSSFMMQAARDAGARGYVSKSQVCHDLLAAVEAVGQPQVDPLVGVCSTVPVLVDKGQAPGYARTGRANPDRKRAQAALQPSEEQFRTLADSIPQLAWIADTNGWLFWYNRSWYQYTGATAEQMVGWGWQSVHDPERLPSVMKRWEDSIRSGQPFEMELLLRGADGVYRWFLTRATPLRNAKGRLVRWVGTNTKIHGQRESRRALEESRDRLEVALAASATGTFRWDPRSGKFLDFDEYLKRLFGIPAEHPVGATEDFLLRLHPDDLPTLKAKLDACQSRADFAMEYRVVLPDGGTRWLYGRAKMLPNPASESTCLVGACTDISPRKHAEEALRQAQEQLESLIEQRTADLRQLSARLLHVQDEERRRIARELHDSLGQYLTAVKINLDLLLSSSRYNTSELLSEARELVERSLSETRTLSHLLHPPLLDEAGFDSAARWYVEGFAKRSGIQVNLDMPAELERMSSRIEITLFRVLQESLTNVYRHSGSSSVDINLQIENGRATLRVRDYGRGFRPRLREGTERSRTPTGVGLAGMRERVKELGGHMDLQSSAEGTALVVTVPLPPPDLGAVITLPKRAAGSAL